MRILVVSDSHHDPDNFVKAIRSNSSAEVIIHCGDSLFDIEGVAPQFPDKKFITVRGNCDYVSKAPYTETITLEGKKIFITHGHLYDVKSGLSSLISAAREENADIVLFGHTHRVTQLYDDGLYILNPGSLKGLLGSYAVVDITPKGILTNIVEF